MSDKPPIVERIDEILEEDNRPFLGKLKSKITKKGYW